MQGWKTITQCAFEAQLLNIYAVSEIDQCNLTRRSNDKGPTRLNGWFANSLLCVDAFLLNGHTHEVCMGPKPGSLHAIITWWSERERTSAKRKLRSFETGRRGSSTHQNKASEITYALYYYFSLYTLNLFSSFNDLVDQFIWTISPHQVNQLKIDFFFFFRNGQLIFTLFY